MDLGGHNRDDTRMNRLRNETRRDAPPRAVFGYGLAGLLPFAAPPLAGLLWPEVAGIAAFAAAAYGALILSFLGGARWGLEIIRPTPRLEVVTLAMLPTLAGLGLLLLPAEARVWQLIGLALALALHFLWDRRSDGLPGWYPQLRLPLTLGAATSLLAMAALV